MTESGFDAWWTARRRTAAFRSLHDLVMKWFPQPLAAADREAARWVVEQLFDALAPLLADRWGGPPATEAAFQAWLFDLAAPGLVGLCLEEMPWAAGRLARLTARERDVLTALDRDRRPASAVAAEHGLSADAIGAVLRTARWEFTTPRKRKVIHDDSQPPDPGEPGGGVPTRPRPAH